MFCLLVSIPAPFSEVYWYATFFYNPWFIFILAVMSDIHLISGYKGNSVTGLIGSSVNFSWSFSNGTKGVRGVLFGLIKNHRARDFIPNGILVAFGESGSPASVPVPVQYNGRVSGSYDGKMSTGHAIFTLSSIKKDDERFFGCRVSPQYHFDAEVFDSVYLNVAGGLCC